MAHLQFKMPTVPETSTTLLKDIASDAGNARWAEFVSRYRPMMLAFLSKHFPLLDGEDVVQETLAALVSVLSRYRYDPEETGHFRSYLTGILRNKALKRCKSQVRESMAREGLRQELSAARDSHSAGQIGECGDWRRAVMEIAMRQLLADDQIHERSKQIFQRLTVDGLSPDSVAEAYGVSRNVVDKIKGRMIGRLREIVRKLEEAGDV